MKQTEIGMIPEDWEVVDLSDAVEFLDGQRRPIKANERKSGPYPYYGASGIIDFVEDYIFDDELILLGEDGENILSRNLPLAFTVKGKIWVNNHAHVLKPNPTYHIKFLCDYLESLDYKLLNSGTAQPKLNKQSCLNIKIVTPPLPEQEAIAGALSDADAWIENLEQLIAKKHLIKQGAMQELLTPKEGWEVKKLGEVAIVTGAGVDKKIIDGEKSVILLNYLDVYRRDYIYKDELSHHVTAPNFKIEQCDIRKGDILITPSSELSNDIGITALAMEDMPNVVYSYHLYRIRFLEEIDWRFRLYLFKNRFFLNQAEKFAEGSGKRYVISLSKVREFDIAYPKFLSEQERIARVLSDMDAELEALEQQLHKVRQIKQGMMQELLTGRIRLNYDASDGL